MSKIVTKVPKSAAFKMLELENQIKLRRITQTIEVAKHLAAVEVASIRYHENIPAATDRVVSFAEAIVAEIYQRAGT